MDTLPHQREFAPQGTHKRMPLYSHLRAVDKAQVRCTLDK
jgi:hypothetical protein